ncbi:MAG: YfiR family protein [Terriglobales bacterium]
MKVANLTPAKVMGGRGPGRGLWVLGVVVLVLSRMSAQSPAAGEYQVKAAFLYNFAKFVEWPPGSFADRAAPLRICVFGQDPFGEELHHIANDKIINGRKLVVDEVADLMAARSCHILFIASSKKAEMKQIVESLRGADVLTVGDTKGFAKMGGMINFVLEDDRVRFEVNQTAAEQTGLRISSKLLSVAVLVIG